MPIIARDNGVIIDSAASDIDFAAGLAVGLIGPGTLQIDIPASGIVNNMILNGTIQPAKLDRSYQALLTGLAIPTNVSQLDSVAAGAITILSHTVGIPNDAFYDVIAIGYTSLGSTTATQTTSTVTLAVTNGVAPISQAQVATIPATPGNNGILIFTFYPNQKNVTMTSTLSMTAPSVASTARQNHLRTFAIPRL